MCIIVVIAEAADGGSFGSITTDGHRDVDFTSSVGRRRTRYQVEGRWREYQIELFRNFHKGRRRTIGHSCQVISLNRGDCIVDSHGSYSEPIAWPDRPVGLMST
jgi:hypothetical protein